MDACQHRHSICAGPRAHCAKGGPQPQWRRRPSSCARRPDESRRSVMKKLIVVASVVVLVVGVMGVAAANGDSQRNAFKARLGGYQEGPSISTTGNGQLPRRVKPAGAQNSYTLT